MVLLLLLPRSIFQPSFDVKHHAVSLSFHKPFESFSPVASLCGLSVSLDLDSLFSRRLLISICHLFVVMTIGAWDERETWFRFALLWVFSGATWENRNLWSSDCVADVQIIVEVFAVRLNHLSRSSLRGAPSNDANCSPIQEIKYRKRLWTSVAILSS